ncbi:ABC transporter ATP-binding protein/permease [Paenibacillus sp. p3-SID867]|uniref:ABC transporter ATP-binding protein n=1 Tax=Paenibacillus sp. p3-SID867 TaxID=2916363 RepID=UPI0021A2A8D1|nr:ABC transporter ATP-binding protein/permease [Paenibacillus sp. p3-SID867]
MVGTALLLSLLETAGVLIVPLFTGRIVDQLSAGNLDSMLIAFLIGAFVLQAVSGSISYYLMSYMGEWVVASLRKNVWSRVLRLPVSYFDQSSSGETMSRVSNDTETVKGLIDQLVSFVSGIITVAGAVIILFILDWRMMLIMTVAAPLAYVILKPIGKTMYGLSLGAQDEMAAFNGGMARVLGDIRLVKAYNAEQDEYDRGSGKIHQLFGFNIRQARIMAIINPLMTLVMMALLVLLVGYGGAQVASGALTAGTMVAIILYLLQIIYPIVNLASFFTEFQKAMGATERIQQIFQHVAEPTSQDSVQTLPTEEKDLVFEQVSFQYAVRGDDKEVESETVLTDIDCVIPAGKITAIVGPSGAGKTTLFSLIERFYQPAQGEIRYGDVPVRDVDLHAWRSQIGFVAQESPLMEGTIRDNIGYGVGSVTDERVKEAAEAAYATEFIDRFREGYDTYVGERGMKLSGGQRQRIAIARALIRNPSILMLDEATSSLDSQSEFMIRKAFDTLMSGRTTIVIAHRLSTVMNADQIIVLEKGRITGTGKHEELLENHALYRRLAKQQFYNETAIP